MQLKLNQGEVIIEQGETDSTYLYVVMKGELSAKKTMDGTEIHLTTFGKGDMFGEVSMILGKPRAATITAASKEVVLKRLDKKEFLKEIKKDPMLAWNLLEKLAAQTEKFDELRNQFLQISG